MNLEPAIIVIFGITGDLSKRYLLPALYHLLKENLLHEKTFIIGLSRREVSAQDLLNGIDFGSNQDSKTIETMASKIHMVQLDPADSSEYERLHGELDKLENEIGMCLNRIFYLSIPPQLYSPIIRNLGENKLNAGCQHGKAESRLLVEKPFGYDLASAQDLVSEITQWFKEDQVFRIDHYLAKETVQNILTFRRENHVFESLWNNQHITRIEIYAFEQIGIEDRVGFYDNVGALRDFVQNHLLNLLALTAMDLPVGSSSENIHQARRLLLDKICPVQNVDQNVVRGQYDSYRDEVDNPKSTTETYVKLRLKISSDRWEGVPIYLSTGKALSAKETAIKITFKAENSAPPNQLTFRLQPNEGIDLKLCVKKPNLEHEVEAAAMDFSYQNHFGNLHHPDAYERVLADAIRGDQTLFTTSSEVLTSWQILQPILDAWSKTSGDIVTYQSGTSEPPDLT